VGPASLLFIGACSGSSGTSPSSTGSSGSTPITTDSGTTDSGETPPALEVVLKTAEQGLCLAKTIHSSDEARRATQLAAMDAAGVRLVRQEVRWDKIQPEPDTWSWESTDTTIDAVTGAGMEVIGLLAYGNPWATQATEDDHFFPPDDPEDYAAFAAAAADHYAGRVDRWEIWNEPNAGWRFWKQDPPVLEGDPAAYAALFVAAARAIHEVQPGAEVMIGGTFFHEQVIPGAISFLSEAAEAEPALFDEADALAFHPYPLYPPRVPPEAATDGEIPLWEMTAQLRALAGDQLPLVATELGWPSWDSVSEEEQASWLIREVALAHASGVRDVCWYTLADGDEPEGNPEEAFGLYRHDEETPKAAGEAYAAFAEALGTDAIAWGRAEEALGLPDGVLATRYTTAAEDRIVTVLWTLEGDAAAATLAAEGCGGWEGLLGAAPTVDADGAVTIDVTPQPTILVERCSR